MSSGQINNTIALTTGPNSVTKFLEEPVLTGKTIYPGMLCFHSGFGVAPHFVAGAWVEGLVAVENPYSGGTIDTPYLEEQRCMLRTAIRGDVFLIKVAALTDPNLYRGTILTSNGDGWLKQEGVGDWVVGISLDEETAPAFPRWTRVKMA